MKQFSFILSLFGFALLFQSCGSGTDILVSKEPQMLKLSAPVTVNTADSTVIELGDYFLYPNKIDSFFVDKSLTARITKDSLQMVLRPGARNIPMLSALTVWSKGFSYTLILERSQKIHYRFGFNPGNKKYKKVQIAGQMNVSFKTVHSFRGRIKEKLKLSSATEVLREALRWHDRQITDATAQTN